MNRGGSRAGASGRALQLRQRLPQERPCWRSARVSALRPPTPCTRTRRERAPSRQRSSWDGSASLASERITGRSTRRGAATVSPPGHRLRAGTRALRGRSLGRAAMVATIVWVVGPGIEQAGTRSRSPGGSGSGTRAVPTPGGNPASDNGGLRFRRRPRGGSRRPHSPRKPAGLRRLDGLARRSPARGRHPRRCWPPAGFRARTDGRSGAGPENGRPGFLSPATARTGDSWPRPGAAPRQKELER